MGEGRGGGLTQVAEGGAKHDDALELAEDGGAVGGRHDFGDEGVEDEPDFWSVSGLRGLVGQQTCILQVRREGR